MEINRKGFSKEPQIEPETPEKKLREVASLYEKQFLREMLKQMRNTVSESELMPSSFAEKYYREQLDQQYVESWGDQGGIGLGKLIFDQLVEKYGERFGIKVPKEKIKGPLPLGIKDHWNGSIVEKNRAIEFQRSKNTKNESTELVSPWDGRWLGSFEVTNGLRAAQIEHEGIHSMIIGDFQNHRMEPGQRVRGGESIGMLAPQATSVVWKINSNNL